MVEQMDTPLRRHAPRATLAFAVVLGAGVSACGKGGPPYVQFANGFDFAVTAKVTDGSGHTTNLEIPAHGRVGADLEGENTIEFLTSSGASMEHRKYTFAKGDKRKKGCQEYVNVLGSAAILEEDIVYGVGLKGGGELLSGNRQAKVCPRWGFETKQPPAAVSVKGGASTVGMNLTWIHYLGEGDWLASVQTLLDRPPQRGDQDRILAWNIAVAVSKYDPNNPRLTALGPRFKDACHKIVDLFTTGPLAGKAEQDCLRNTQRLFPAS